GDWGRAGASRARAGATGVGSEPPRLAPSPPLARGEGRGAEGAAPCLSRLLAVRPLRRLGVPDLPPRPSLRALTAPEAPNHSSVRRRPAGMIRPDRWAGDVASRPLAWQGRECGRWTNPRPGCCGPR